MMSFVRDLFSNPMLIAPLLAWAAAQISKMVITLITEREIRLDRLLGDGGMPSGHSATVSALCVIVGYVKGLSSAAFAIAVILAIIVMHDATGVRRETGKQALTILDLISAINDMVKEKDRIVQNEKLKIFVGHSPVQVFFGSLLGVAIAVLYILIAQPTSFYL